MTMVDLDKPVQVLAKEGWHPGVLGIVSGRIMEQISQTVVVLNIEDGLAKGSARSLNQSISSMPLMITEISLLHLEDTLERLV